MEVRSNFLWGRAFFGLTPKDRPAVLLEPFFALGYYFGMSWETYYNFPVAYKEWLVSRINKELQKYEDSGDHGSKSFQVNNLDANQLRGKTRSFPTNSRLHRFT